MEYFPFSLSTGNQVGVNDFFDQHIIFIYSNILVKQIADG